MGSIWGANMAPFLFPKPPQMRSKLDPEGSRNDSFSLRFLTLFCLSLGPRWAHVGTRLGPKSAPELTQDRPGADHTPRGTPGGVPPGEDGPRLGPSWDQNQLLSRPRTDPGPTRPLPGGSWTSRDAFGTPGLNGSRKLPKWTTDPPKLFFVDRFLCRLLIMPWSFSHPNLGPKIFISTGPLLTRSAFQSGSSDLQRAGHQPPNLPTQAPKPRPTAQARRNGV